MPRRKQDGFENESDNGLNEAPGRVFLSAKEVARFGDSVIVERVEADGRLQRRIVPARLLNGDKIAKDDWDAGAVYGVEWERYIALSTTPERVAEQLRRAGIWTKSDLLKNPRAAFGALQSAYNFDLSALIEAVRDLE